MVTDLSLVNYFYRLPSCKYLLLYINGIESIVNPQGLLIDKIITFSIADQVYNNNKEIVSDAIGHNAELYGKVFSLVKNQISIKIDISIEEKAKQTLSVKFNLDSNIYDRYKISDNRYGIIINSQTQFILTQDMEGGYYSHYYYADHGMPLQILLKSNYSTFGNKDNFLIFKMHDNSVIVPLISYCVSCFAYCNEEKNMTIKSVLLEGNSGSGLTTLAVGLARLLNIPYIIVTLGHLASSCKSDQDIKSFWLQIFHLSIQMSPCVVIIDDIHFMFDNDNITIRNVIMYMYI